MTAEVSSAPRRAKRAAIGKMMLAGAATALLSACEKPLDFDLRGNFGNALSTTDAAQKATAARPRPDDRGVISYPGYQVAVARRGDTVVDVANRVGADPAALARYNGVKLDDKLRKDEVIALPSRVAEPSPATGAVTTGPIQPPSNVDITALAGGAIDRAQPAQVQTSALDKKPQTGLEPTRHKVQRGETAYTIARLYGVSVRALADWNGLGRDFDIREGQFLLIPVPDAAAPKVQTAAAPAPAPASKPETPPPGAGSPTPTPPSASKPLPRVSPPPAAATTATAAATPAPNLGKTQTKPKPASGGAMGFPVNGSIIREYSKGKTDGIDIQAAPGTSITAAANGTVAAITSDADQVPIIVVKHPDNLLTVYANVDGIAVKKGDSVKRGQKLAKIRGGNSNYVHFEVRKGFDSVDPMPYLR